MNICTFAGWVARLAALLVGIMWAPQGAAQTSTLTVTQFGSGTGTVTSTPAGIACPSDCAEVYANGTVVTLTAAPSAGSTFTGWSGGGCTGTGACVVAMNSATTVTATFTLNSYTLTTTRVGTGSGTILSTPSGINCGADCTEVYPHGSMVVLTATAAVGSTFAGWSGGGCTGTGSCVVTMTSATSVTATFTLSSFTISVAKAGLGTGTVTSSPAGITCGADCTEAYAPGTLVTLTAAPGVNSVFAGWSGACTGTGSCVVTVNSAISVTATFNSTLPVLTVTSAGTGSGVVSSSPAGINCGGDCSEPYPIGTLVTLTALPNIGSVFTGWSGGCAGTLPCNLTMSGNTTVVANFTLSSVPLTIVYAGTGSAVTTSSPPGINCPGSCSAMFTPGTVVSLAAVPGSGTLFTSFAGADTASGNVATVTMNSARTVTVNLRCAADFNASGAVTVQDVFDFLATYFAGCP